MEARKTLHYREGKDFFCTIWTVTGFQILLNLPTDYVSAVKFYISMKGFFFNLSTPDFGFGRQMISLYCTWLLASIDEHVVSGGLGGVGLEAHDVVRQVSVQPAQD